MTVQYLGGLTVWSRKPSPADTYSLVGTDECLKVMYWSAPVFGKGAWIPAVDIRWTSLRAVDVSSTSTPQPSAGAIALFGVFALAAARDAGTYISLTTDGMDALFLSEEPVAKVRPTVERLVPKDFRHLLRYDGRPVETRPASRGKGTIAERLALLQDLHAQALITAEELADRRARILAET